MPAQAAPQAAPQLPVQRIQQAPSPGGNSWSQSTPLLGCYWAGVGPPTPPPTPIRPLSGHLGRLPKGNGSELTNLAATWAHAQSTCGAEGLADLKIQTPKQAFQTTWLPPTLGPRCKLEPGTRCPRPPRRSPGKGGPRAGSLATALAAARPHLCRSRAKPSPHGLRFWLGGLSKNCANTRPHTWC